MPANLGSWLGSTVSTAVKPLYDVFIEHATYPFIIGRNISDLKKDTGTLIGVRQDIERQKHNGLRNGQIETEEARTWLERADKAISDERNNRVRYEQRCKIFGFCSPNCWSNYQISKKAARVLAEVKQCGNDKPTTITAEPPPQPVEPIQVHPVHLQASQQGILDCVLQFVKGDAAAVVGLIGMWGPRQVGKTLLLKMINNSVNGGEPPPFDLVIYLTVSDDCSVERIQSQIMQRLKMQDGGSVTAPATRIYEFLRDKSFLVLIDNLQHELDLAAVGLPHPLGTQEQLKRKVVITTRSRRLCVQMCVTDVEVPGLEKDEALELFKDSSGDENLYSHPVRAHAEDLVDKLIALPAELINFGRDMRGKGDPSQWQDVIHVVKELIDSENEQVTSLGEGIMIKLKKQVEKLRKESSVARDSIELAKKNDMVATNKAQTWLTRADTIISESKRNELNRDISMAATKLRELQECLKGRPSDIAQPPSVIYIPVNAVLQPSQARFVEQARHHIIDDPRGTIGIWGPVGTGKTLLLKTINNSFYTENSSDLPPFDHVIFLTVSEECSVQKIQSGIMQRLKMLDGNSATPQENRASRMVYECLKDTNFLVLLDGLQVFVDTTEVGIPHPLGIQGQLKRKVVITTRSQSLYGRMHVNIDINVPALDMNEALQLFQQSVGDEIVCSDPQIRELSKGLAEELRALPLELINIGKAMHGKGNPRQWEDVIRVVKELIRRKNEEALSMTGRIVRKLAEGIENLRARSNDVRHEIELAERKGRVATNGVNIWLSRVDTIISDAEAICKSEENELNWDVTVIATDKLRDLQECLNNQPSNIAVDALPPSVQEMPGSSTEQQPSRAIQFQKAMQYIKDDPVGVIGIWGLGGVGKTHLLTRINNSFIGDSFFENVIFVTVSKEGSMEKIQNEIVSRLGLQQNGGGVKYQANIILNFLKRRSFLILLDDVWNEIDLEEIGIPYPLGSADQKPKRKVVLTTRSKKVCGLMEVRKEIEVTCLSHDESWKLFEDKVGQRTLFSNSPRITAIAKDLVEELKGLPLALITVGRAMYKKCDPKQWEDAVHYMKQSCYGVDDQDLDMEKRVLPRLKFSYDMLRNDTLRHCFLTCSLWPEDCKIVLNDLIQCWIGLGLVDERDIHNSYRKAHSLIGDLTAACLLDRCENLFYKSEDYLLQRTDYTHQVMPVNAGVKMHDVIRDMAIWISGGCSDNMDKWAIHSGVGANLSRHNIPWSRAECISLMLNGIEKLPPVRPIPCPTNLKILYLQSNNMDHRIFGAIRSFTQLTYLDLSWNSIKEIPEELCAMVNLQYLNLSRNSELCTVPVCLRELSKLKFLYLGGTCIKGIPNGVISCLKELQVIDLTTERQWPPVSDYTSIIQELCTLTNLKAVDIVTGDDFEYELLRKAGGIPVRDLIISGLEETDVFCLAEDTLTDDIARSTLCELHVESCQIEQIILGDGPGKPFDALNVLVLKLLDGLKDIVWKATSLQDLFPRLTHLYVFRCHKLQDLSWALCLPCLEYLFVNCCDTMRQVFVDRANHGLNTYRGQEVPKTFPCLKYLILWSNPELARLCDSDLTFPSLEKMEISHCPELKRLPFTMQSLPHKMTELSIISTPWDDLEWEEEGVKSFLQSFLKY